MPARDAAGPVGFDPPFRPFFVLGTLDAILGVGVWLPAFAGWSGADLGAAAPAWHARELLFGAFPAVITGFLLTALPRWTGRAFGHPWLGVLLAMLWLSGPASLLTFPAARPAIAAGYMVILAWIVGHHVLRTGNRRNVKILLLVALLACASLVGLLDRPGAPEMSFRLAISAILGLVMVLGGRIIPSLTAVHLERRGKAGLPRGSRSLDIAAAATAMGALSAWALAPDAWSTALLGAIAAAGQTARCVRWQPWRVTASPSIVALHAAYACIPIGFALMGARALLPATDSTGGALHVWAVGAIGLMSVAVMASMIRRHVGRPLTTSRAINSAFALLIAALILRYGADLIDAEKHALLLGALGAWIVAHLLFLLEFGRDLILWPGRSPGMDCRCPDPAGDGSGRR